MSSIRHYTQPVPGFSGMTFWDIGWLESLVKRYAKKETNALSDSQTLLHVNALEGNVKECERLLKMGYNPNAKDKFGHTPLFCAIQSKNVLCCELLLTNGANANAEDNNGNTPLIKAIAVGDLDVLRVLLVHEADVNKKSKYGETPLFIANCEKNLKAAKLLISYGGVSEFVVPGELF